MRTALAIVGMLLLGAAPQDRSQPPVRTVPMVDLDRYDGDWFEIARYPNRFQAKCAGDVRATYVRHPEGRIDVINRCRETEGGMTDARGVARVVDKKTSSKLQVRFAPSLLSWLPAVWGDYWILGLGEDYSWAVVGSPDRKYLWILARAMRLDDATYARAVEIARTNGFDPGRLVMTQHTSSSE